MPERHWLQPWERGWVAQPWSHQPTGSRKESQDIPGGSWHNSLSWCKAEAEQKEVTKGFRSNSAQPRTAQLQDETPGSQLVSLLRL